MSDTIDYANLMHDAMRHLIKKVLREVEADGLPGSHHFFITFDTSHPDAELADWLSDRYPEEMTIVMQHWFDKLEVGEEGFGIRLNFGDTPEPLYVPYDAIKTFVDPSVEFGLRFEPHLEEEEDILPHEDDEDAEDEDTSLISMTDSLNLPEEIAKAEEGKKAGGKEAEIVSLDKFRK